MNLQPAEEHRDPFARIPIVDQALELAEMLNAEQMSSASVLRGAALLMLRGMHPPALLHIDPAAEEAIQAAAKFMQESLKPDKANAYPNRPCPVCNQGHCGPHWICEKCGALSTPA